MPLTFNLISIFSMLHNILQILSYYYSICKYSHLISNLNRRLVVFFLFPLKGQFFPRSRLSIFTNTCTLTLHDNKCHQAVNQLGTISILHIAHSFYHMNFKTFKPFSSFLFYFVFKLCMKLIITACACPSLVLEACNPFSP